MMSGTHETAPHGLAALTAHPRGALGGLGMHGCLGGGRSGSRRLAGDVFAGDVLAHQLRPPPRRLSK